jgi:hypothetical protein
MSSSTKTYIVLYKPIVVRKDYWLRQPKHPQCTTTTPNTFIPTKTMTMEQFDQQSKKDYSTRITNILETEIEIADFSVALCIFPVAKTICDIAGKRAEHGIDLIHRYIEFDDEVCIEAAITFLDPNDKEIEFMLKSIQQCIITGSWTSNFKKSTDMEKIAIGCSHKKDSVYFVGFRFLSIDGPIDVDMQTDDVQNKSSWYTIEL